MATKPVMFGLSTGVTKQSLPTRALRACADPRTHEDILNPFSPTKREKNVVQDEFNYQAMLLQVAEVG